MDAMWDGCPSEWKIGDGVGFSEEKTIPEDEARSPKDCVDKCSKLRNHKVAANQATVDSRSGSYCHCRFNASGINDRRNRRTCIIKTVVTTPAVTSSKTSKGGTKSVSQGGSKSSQKESKNQITIISGAVGVGAGILAIGVMIILIRRRKKLKNNRLTDEVTLTSLAGGADSYEKNSRNPYYDSTLPMGANNNNGFIPPEDDESQLGYIVEISRDRLAYIEKLGEGAFGKVVKCTLADEETHKTMICAVKYLKQGASEYTVSTFLREAKTLASFQHPNIIGLLGACLDDKGPPCIVLEFMECGDLTEYIRDRAGSYHASFGRNGQLPPGIEYEPPSLSHHKLIYIAGQIASGMAYLSDRKFIHRDLATRNCLVSEDLLIKIADFGLGHDISSLESDYYRVDGQKLLPVRWLPPEALTMGKFTIASDIWSYGVLLWELFSYGMTPYHGIGNEEVLQKVKCYEILEYPDDCPEEIYELMQECWRYDPNKRIPFKSIVEILSSWMDQDEYNTLCNVHEATCESL